MLRTRLDAFFPPCRQLRSANPLTPFHTHTAHTSKFHKNLHTTSRSLSSWNPNAPRDSDIPTSLFGDSSSGSEKGDGTRENYPFVTSAQLASYREPPKSVRMLVRDFIEDSLYNPHYGYFSKNVRIFESSASGGGVRKGFDFGSIKNGAEFEKMVAERYVGMGKDPAEGPGRQVWHTPTELFRPHYAHAHATCIVSEYLLKHYPYEDLHILEIGAGNGTLALDTLDFICSHYPEVYERTRYTIVEISEKLASVQRKTLERGGHGAGVVQVVRRNVLEWDRRVPGPVFVVMMEVADNLAHDLIRYDNRTLEPYQGVVQISPSGDFNMTYTPIMDPLIKEYLSLSSSLTPPSSPLSLLSSLLPSSAQTQTATGKTRTHPIHPLLLSSPLLRQLYTSLPFTPNLSQPHYIPTRLFSLLRTLHTYLPRHRLLLSDFSSLPDAVQGINGPVVQTRVRGDMVPCSTLLVKQGFFDIFFPTNFEELRGVYEELVGRPSGYVDPGSAVRFGIEPDRPTVLAPYTTSLSLDGAFFTPASSCSSTSSPSSFLGSRLANRRNLLPGLASASGLPVGERKSSVWTHREFLETYRVDDADGDGSGRGGGTRLANGEDPMVEWYENVRVLF